MSKSARRPQRIFSAVMWLLSIVFAGFLIGLGSLVIRDLPTVDRNIQLEQFVDQSQLQSAQDLTDQLASTLTGLSRAVEDTQIAYGSASADYASAKDSFDNWIATRSATESAAQNPEVLRRTRALEALKADERAALRGLEDARAAKTKTERALSDARSVRSDIMNAARPEYRKALRAQDLKVFLIRLAITLPLLLIGGWMLMRKRTSSYWPLYRGFILFALFAFFVELVPYLPSYGGYVRYAVGIVMVVAAGHFIIRGMRQYMARKQEEEARSEVERRKSIGYETALKKIAAKSCPGCDRTIITREGVNTDFCVHCGIRLQSECGNCGTRNISFHKFCLCCGAPSKDVPSAAV